MSWTIIAPHIFMSDESGRLESSLET
jgi:hypothetical protein